MFHVNVRAGKRKLKVTRLPEAKICEVCQEIKGIDETPLHHDGAVGIDMGIKAIATLSDGVVFENQRHYRLNLGRIKGLS